MTYVLIITILIFFLICFYKQSKDFLSPHIIYTLSMLVCSFCALIGLLFWNDVAELNIITILIIIISVFSFAIGCFSCTYFFNNKKIHIRLSKSKKRVFSKFLGIKNNQIYDFNNKYIFLEMIFVIITLVLMFIEVRRIAYMAGYDGTGFGNMINKFRELSILYTTELVENGRGVNIVVSQMRKICDVICVFNIFLVVRVIKDKIKFNYKFYLYLLIIFMCFALSLFTGGRMQLFIYLLSFIFMISFYKYGGKNILGFIKSNYKKIGIVCLIAIVGFYILLPLSGRNTKTNIVSYMSFYLGTSIPSLDKYNNMKRESPKYFGEETLRGLYNVLYKFNITKNVTPISKEWVTFNDENNNNLSSNIFTSAKRYYHDFGIIGVIICQMIFGFVFMFIYIIAKNSNFALVFYSMYFYMCVDQIRDELFFADFIHINMVFKFAVLFGLFSLLTVVKKGRRKYEK